MTRDHDIKRAIRARMKVTGERYTVARSAFVAPTALRPGSETSESQGGAMASVHTGLIDELDEYGFSIIASFASPEAVASMTAVVDDVVAATLAEKQQQLDQRQAAGEGRIDVWHPGEAGVVFRAVTDRPDVQWLLQDQRLLTIVHDVKGSRLPLRHVGALASMPGFGHQGFHPDDDGPSPAIGSWDKLVFVLVLSPHRSDTGTIRALPGSHRTPPQFTDLGSAMPPHDDEVRVDAEPGDLFVYSGHLWKSATFNGGREPLKSMLVAGDDDVGWGRR